MSDREIKAAGEALLLKFATDPLAIPRAIKAKDFVSLAGIADIASREVSPSMALLHPARFRVMRRAISDYYVRGYALLDKDVLKRRALAQIAKGKQS
jgi:hypothetical protein